MLASRQCCSRFGCCTCHQLKHSPQVIDLKRMRIVNQADWAKINAASTNNTVVPLVDLTQQPPTFSINEPDLGLSPQYLGQKQIQNRIQKYRRDCACHHKRRQLSQCPHLIQGRL